MPLPSLFTLPVLAGGTVNGPHHLRPGRGARDPDPGRQAEHHDAVGRTGRPDRQGRRGPASSAEEGPGVTGALPLLVRISLAVAVTLVVAAVRLLLGAGRLGLWLLALAGFRGARLVALAATGGGVSWAGGRVGLR